MASPNDLKILFWNCNSISGKTHFLETELNANSPDIFALTETKIDSTFSDNSICTNYTLYRHDRVLGGGGVLIGILNSCNIKVNYIDKCEFGEILALGLEISGFSFIMAVYYHRPVHRNVDDIIRWFNNQTHHDIVIVGDFNLPDIEWKTKSLKTNRDAQLHNNFLNFLIVNNLSQPITFPTHTKGNTLDLIVSNIDISNINGQPSFSDHLIINFSINPMTKFNRDKQQQNFNPFWLFNKANTAEIMHDCSIIESEIDNAISLNKTVDEVWAYFKSSLLDSVAQNIPHVVRKCRSKHWITRATIRNIRKRNRLYKVYTRFPTEVNLIGFKIQAKYCKRLVNEDYNKFVNSHICDNLETGNLKPLFRFIASKQGSSNSITRLDGCPNDSLSEIAETFADAFASVFTIDNNQHPTYPVHPTHQIDSIVFDAKGVLKQLLALNPRKSCGPDQLSPSLLKFIAHYIYRPLTKIFQHSYDTHTAPNDWKIAHVIPIYKKGSRTAPLNYRPISLTSIISKIFEHVLSHNIHNYLDEHELLYYDQHGFRVKHGCDTQLLNTITDFVEYYDNNIPVDIAVLDFAKAFDVVSHSKLCNKISAMGIHRKTCLWIKNWLSKRTLSVTINGTTSSPRAILSGVPQGSVLGPLLFLIFINDMPDFISSGSLKLFADDSLLYLPIHHPSDANLLQQDLNCLLDWATSFQMKFNVSKCEHMRISRSTNVSNVSYSMHSNSLKSVDTIKYLGITIDSRLSFEQHILNICKKANNILHMLMRNLKKAKPKTRETAFKTICRPILEFATHSWSPYKLKLINFIENINRKAFRWSHNLRKFDHITDLMNKYNWPTLESRRTSSDINMFTRMLSGNAAVDIDRFSKHQSSQHDTRHGATVGQINTDTMKFSYKHRITKLSNKVFNANTP